MKGLSEVSKSLEGEKMRRMYPEDGEVIALVNGPSLLPLSGTIGSLPDARASSWKVRPGTLNGQDP